MSSASVLETAPWNQTSFSSCSLMACREVFVVEVVVVVVVVPPSAGSLANGPESKGSSEVWRAMVQPQLTHVEWILAARGVGRDGVVGVLVSGGGGGRREVRGEVDQVAAAGGGVCKRKGEIKPLMILLTTLGDIFTFASPAVSSSQAGRRPRILKHPRPRSHRRRGRRGGGGGREAAAAVASGRRRLL